MFKQRIEQALSSRAEKGLSRRLQVLEGGNQPQFSRDGQQYINFSSNDYLGMATEPELVKAWQKGLDRYGAGSGASPLVTGFSRAHAELEQTLCHWLGYERAVLFNSGFSANQAVLFSLLEKNDRLLQDKLNHASLMEAGMLSPASMKRFRHNDPAHLNQLLSQPALVVTEGVFSMDGDTSPLAEIQQVCNAHDSWLMVDDAHGIGVLGEQGRGSCSAAGIKPQLLVVTFGKGFGLSGAAVLCDNRTGDYLTQFARHHVYSTAMPPAQAFALDEAAKMIQSQQWRRDRLAELLSVYNNTLSGVEGFVATQTPIKPFICGDAGIALSMANNLKSRGFWATAIRPPTVPQGSARIRITLTANHTPEQVKALADAMVQFSEEHNRES
jgi:8-amino-7-oxononanoate synthase